MTHKQNIIQQLKAGVPLTDAQLKARLKTTHQTINQACRQLEAAGLISRSEGPDGYIVNRPVDGVARPAASIIEASIVPQQSHVERGTAFQELAGRVLGARFGCTFRLEEMIAIGSPAKNHRFDLVSTDRQFVGECKSFSWTSGGNMPSAKITTVNEAVFYLSLLSTESYRFVTMRRDIRPGSGESLASYYWRTNRHLLGGVDILEIDAESGAVEVIGD